MADSKTEKIFSQARVSYFLEFSRFLSGFVVLIAVALILMNIISVNVNTVVKNTIAHTTQSD